MNNSISCIIVDDEAMARNIIASHLSKIKSVNVVALCKNAIEAFNTISNTKIDLVFLDINMPEISGIAFAKSINKDIKIIFTTAYRDYAVDGFDLQALDYLLKPISFERLLKAVNRYYDASAQIESNTKELQEQNDFIFVRSNRRMLKVEFNSILYIESYSDYIKIHTETHHSSPKIESIVTRETISAIEAKLPQNQFIRIHRSFIVKISKIESYNNEDVTVNRKALPISRSYKKEVLNQLKNF